MLFSPSTNPVWVNSNSAKGEIPQRTSGIGLGVVGASIGTLGLFGHSIVKGRSLWDWTARGARAAEFLTPGFIGRTFRLSEALSPFETARSAHWAPHHLNKGKFAEYVSSVTGLSLDELTNLDVFRQGLSFTPTSKNLGVLTSGSGRLVASNISLMRFEGIGSSVGNWYARTFGLDFGEHLFETNIDEYQPPKFIPIQAVSSSTRARVRYAQGLAGQVVGRFNKLLASPFESEFLEPYTRPLVKKFPILERLNLSVKPGTAGKMLGRYALKGSALIGAVGFLNWADYRRRENNSLLAVPEFALYGALGASVLAPRNAKSLGKYAAIGGLVGGLVGLLPNFNRGIYSGLGSIWAGANLSRAALSDALGLTEAVKSQEQYLPQSTRFTTLLGFAGAGALYGGFAQYARRLNITRKYTSRLGLSEGTKLAARYIDLLPKLQGRAAREWAKGKGFSSDLQNIAEAIGKTGWIRRGAIAGGALFTGFSVLGALSAGSPLSASIYGASGALGLYGLAKKSPILAGAGLLLPFLLRSNQSAGELADIYSGYSEVPIMKSRWWESNRCLTTNTYIATTTNTKSVADIEVGDQVISRNGEVATVLEIFKREYDGEVLRLSTAYDREVFTEVTPNHIIPVLRNNILQEIPASEIKWNDFVELPIRNKFSYELSSLETTIVKGYIVENDRLYTTQRSHYSGAQQKSGTSSIPLSIPLDENFGRLLGYLYADGNLSFRGDDPRVVEFAFDSYEHWMAKDVQDLLQDIFGVKSSISFRTDGPKAKEGHYRVRASSVILSKFIHALCYEGRRKVILSWLYKTSPEFRLGFCEGYWRGDGHLDGDYKVYVGKNKSFLKYCQDALWSVGIVATLGFVDWSSEDSELSRRYTLRLGSSEPCASIRKIGEQYFVRIKAIESDHYAGVVYDFEVDHESHLLQAGDFLVHNSPWEGSKPLYYRKHWVAMQGDAAKETALYGSEAAYWATQGPLDYLVDPYAQEKLMWKQGFKFPVTGQAFDEMPVLGPLVSETVGQLVKPRRMMAPETWTQPGAFGGIGPSYLYQPGATSERGIIPSMSGYPEPSQQGLGYAASYQEHLLKEVVGLPGFVTESIQAGLFGSKIVGGEDRTYLASATQLSGVNKAYWDMNLGGGAGLSEMVRRLVAKDPGFDYYNPFRTDMPAWLPGDKAGYFLNFKSAEIFTQLQEPWRRLPGPGWLAANPEWVEQGILSEDTPLGQWPVSARYEVAGDVAAWGRGTAGIRAHLTRVMRSSPESLTPFEYRKIRETDEQIEAIKTKRKFNPYVTSEEGLEKLELTVRGISPGGLIQTDIGPLSLAGTAMTGAQLSEQAIRENNTITIQEAERRASIRSREIGGFVQSNISRGDTITAYVNRFMGARYINESSGITAPAVVYSGRMNLNQALIDAGITSSSIDVNESPLAFRGVYGNNTPLRHAWDALTHAMDTPFEALTPAAPGAKFIHRQTAIEDYERNQLYGREIALWQKPYEHFIKPFGARMGLLAGVDSIPDSEQKQRDIDEYFDKLKFLKYQALAETTNDPRARSEYKRQAAKTLTGINPFSPYVFSKSAFPADVRPYVDSFLNETDPRERQRILSRVSAPVGRAIAGKWEAQELEGLKRKREVAGLSSEEQERFSELDQRSYEESVQGEQRNIQEVNEYFKSHKLPRPNFIGFHPQADLDDFKLSYVLREGCLTHDSGIISTMLGVTNIGCVSKVLGADGSFKEPSQRFENLNSSELLKLTSSGNRHSPIYLTKNHRVPILSVSNNSYRLSLVQVGELLGKNLDKLRVIYPKFKFSENCKEINLVELVGERSSSRLESSSLDLFIPACGYRPVKRTVSLDKDIGKLLGWYLAEGSFITKRGKHTGIQFSLNISEESVAKELEEIVLSKFGLAVSHREDPKKNSRTVTVFSETVARFVKEFILGDSALTKSLSEKALELSKSVLLHIFHSWWRGDGWSTRNADSSLREALICTSSSLLSQQAWYLLNSLGLRTRLRCIPSHLRRTFSSSNPSYRIQISCKNALSGFLNQEEQTALSYLKMRPVCNFEVNEYFWFGFKLETSERFDSLVYDLCIPELPFYCTTAGLVHNSDAHDFGMWEEQRRSLLRKPYIVAEMGQVDPFASDINFGNPYQDLRDSLRDSNHSGMRVEYGSSAYAVQDINVSTEENIDPSVISAAYEGLS